MQFILIDSMLGRTIYFYYASVKSISFVLHSSIPSTLSESIKKAKTTTPDTPTSGK